MFRIEGTTITLSRGDTGEVSIGVSGYSFGSNDRALFTVRNASNQEVKMRRELEIVDNIVTVTFVNSDTDSLPAGRYEWDVRYVINPVYENGQIVDGDEVITPELPMTINLLTTVGQI